MTNLRHLAQPAVGFMLLVAVATIADGGAKGVAFAFAAICASHAIHRGRQAVIPVQAGAYRLVGEFCEVMLFAAVMSAALLLAFPLEQAAPWLGVMAALFCAGIVLRLCIAFAVKVLKPAMDSLACQASPGEKL